MPLNGPGVTVTFLGTSSMVLDDARTKVIIDGFISRPSAGQILFRRLRPNVERIDAVLTHAGVISASAVLVAHSHIDHALDAATVAWKTGAEIIGSASTANIAAGEYFPAERIRTIHGGERIDIGAFRITVFKTPHSPNGQYSGEVPKPLEVPARANRYREGGNYSFLVEHPSHTLLIVPSANYERGMFASVKADTVFLSIGRLGKQRKDFIKNYWREAVLETEVTRVVVIHWDDFTRPLERPLKPMRRFADNVGRALKMLSAFSVADKIELRVPEAFERFYLGRH